MIDAAAVYRLLDARLPHHAGAGLAGLRPAPVSALRDGSWLDARIDAAARLHRHGDRRTLGVLWWYSASSVLLAPTVESVVAVGLALDPAAVTLHLHPDGRVLGARADAVCADPGPRLREVLATSIGCVADRTGARPRALWAIATDSLANRVLWAGGSAAHAEALAASVGPDLPVPRYQRVGGRTIVRRASCCLVYLATGGEKCVSCPRQTPAERVRRLGG